MIAISQHNKEGVHALAREGNGESNRGTPSLYFWHAWDRDSGGLWPQWEWDDARRDRGTATPQPVTKTPDSVFTSSELSQESTRPPPSKWEDMWNSGLRAGASRLFPPTDRPPDPSSPLHTHTSWQTGAWTSLECQDTWKSEHFFLETALSEINTPD